MCVLKYFEQLIVLNLKGINLNCNKIKINALLMLKRGFFLKESKTFVQHVMTLPEWKH